jgi:hypothetical protein
MSQVERFLNMDERELLEDAEAKLKSGAYVNGLQPTELQVISGHLNRISQLRNDRITRIMLWCTIAITIMTLVMMVSTIALITKS